jgi:hypothetical protein
VKLTKLHVNRREWLGGMLALAAPAGLSAGQEKEAREEHTLRNDNLDFRFVTSQGRIISRRLKNKLANEIVDLPEADFVLEFDGGRVADPSGFTARVVRKDSERIELLYSGASEALADLQVRVEYSLLPSKDYLRKQLSVRQAGKGQPRRLMRVELDLWKGVRRDWKSATADRMRYGSHPIFCETMWAGVEFVAAFNEYSREGFVLRSRPGGKTLTSDWLKLHSTVAGVAEPGRVKEAFLRYIDDVRLDPPRLVACYNTWWSLPEIFDEKECLSLVQAVVKSLYERHGVFFDFVTADMGWSDPQSIWAVNKAHFPDGLSTIVETIKSAKGKLGLWMSPSEVYKPVIDYAWAEKNGYAVVGGSNDPSDSEGKGISLADPKYLNAATNQLRRLIEQNQLGQIKYDGFIAREGRGHDNLLPGEDSVEPLAACSLELMKASKEANPKLFTEPTYLNSLANYISPWIMKYADSVWAGGGSDCPAGVGPAPDYRESQTTSREYFIFSALHEVWLPQNAIQSFDIVHCDEAGGFPNHAAMAFGRGRFFVSTYINPKFMTEADWEIYAGLLKWARSNQALLENTVVLPSRVELGEPYAYAHWSGRRGIVAVRNPSNESRGYTLDLAQAGAPKGLSDAVCYTQYPYRRGILAGVTGTSTITLELAPWELVFLEMVPRSELLEPVAIGARWYRDSNGSMKVSSEGASSVRLLLPRRGEQDVTLQPVATSDPRGEVIRQKMDRLPEAHWLRQADKSLPTASFEVESEISIPQGATKGKALLLLEFPGGEHLPSTCSCQVNGGAVAPQESSSAGHVGFNGGGPESAWRGLQPYLSNWTWYICELESGSSRVEFSGVFPYESCKIGLWVWADWDLTPQSVAVSIGCPEPSMPQHQGHLKRRGICVLQPRVPHESPPTEGSWRLT